MILYSWGLISRDSFSRRVFTIPPYRVKGAKKAKRMGLGYMFLKKHSFPYFLWIIRCGRWNFRFYSLRSRVTENKPCLQPPPPLINSKQNLPRSNLTLSVPRDIFGTSCWPYGTLYFCWHRYSGHTCQSNHREPTATFLYANYVDKCSCNYIGIFITGQIHWYVHNIQYR